MGKKFITIGTFDGVHLGHKFIFDTLKQLAAKNNLEPLILTFDFAPKLLKNNDTKNKVLTLPDEKLVLLKQENCEVKKLDFEKIKNLTCQEFFDILIKDYKMGGILTGEDFAFGKDRLGKKDFLSKACAENNIIYSCQNFVNNKEGHKISSSLIRKFLEQGEVSLAAKMLGHFYTLKGLIVKGQQLGRQMGFATANLKIDTCKILPKGVFAVKVFLDNKEYKGVCNIGLRPTVEKNGAPLCEVHILDFNQDIYGKILKIALVSKIRGEKKFDSLGELTQQINKDTASAVKILTTL